MRGIRTSVEELVKLGRMPADRGAVVDQVQAFEVALCRIESPVSDDEAIALLSVLPATEDSCFGLAWTAVHLIESAPNWPLPEAGALKANPWVRSLLERAA